MQLINMPIVQRLTSFKIHVLVDVTQEQEHVIVNQRLVGMVQLPVLAATYTRITMMVAVAIHQH